MVCHAQFVLLSWMLLSAAAVFCADENGALPIPIHNAGAGLDEEALLNPNHPVWSQTKANPLHFHRTPPLYADGPFDDGSRPEAFATFIRLKDQTVFLRLEWKDETENNIEQGTKYPDGGDSHIYKAHTDATDLFGDAACLMVPKSQEPKEAYPSMMMGDAANPVDLYFWKAGAGFSVLQAHGRATTADSNQEWKGRHFRTAQGWVVIFQAPELAKSTPLCFALWDGGKQHRDGLKYYSLWYEVE